MLIFISVSCGYDSSIGENVDRIYEKDSAFTYYTAVIYGVKHTPQALSEKIIVRPYII